MAGYPPEEVARRAGVDPGYVGRLVELGILTPGDGFSPGDVLRARWVESLERSGVPLEAMAVVLREGTLSLSFLGAPAFDRFADLTETTYEELSRETGLPLELLRVIREAIGFGEPGPGDRVREDELSVVPAIALAVATGVPPAVIERLFRAYADGMRRIVEIETDAWTNEVERRFLDEGMSEREMLERQADLGSRFAPLLERALLAIYQGQQEHAWRQSFVEQIEEMLERAGLHHRVRRPPAIAFLDLAGYTRLTEERGDAAAADVAARLARLVEPPAREHGGRPVKRLGDGVMLYFREPAGAVLAALEIVAGAGRHGLPPAHGGIHAGPVVFQEGDYFGRTVNLAARISEYARPGEVVVSQEVVDAAGPGPLSFQDLGLVELRGVRGPLRLHLARPAERGRVGRAARPR